MNRSQTVVLGCYLVDKVMAAIFASRLQRRGGLQKLAVFCGLSVAASCVMLAAMIIEEAPRREAAYQAGQARIAEHIEREERPIAEAALALLPKCRALPFRQTPESYDDNNALGGASSTVVLTSQPLRLVGAPLIWYQDRDRPSSRTAPTCRGSMASGSTRRWPVRRRCPRKAQ